MERGKRENKIGVEDKEEQTTMYKLNKLQGYIIQHRKYRIFYNNYKRSITFKKKSLRDSFLNSGSLLNAGMCGPLYS